MKPIRQRDLSREIEVIASRSGGPGGQHVNKVNSQVQIRFNIERSIVLSTREKETLLYKLRHQLTKGGELIINAQTNRSQFQNKKEALNKLYILLENMLKQEKVRIASRPSKASKIRRLEQKRRHSNKKVLRKKLFE